MDAPGVGVAAVVVHQERVLVIRRARAPGQGRWAFPGGRVQLGEALVTAAAREVLEETGLVVDVLEPLDVVEAIADEGREGYHWVIVEYLARPVAGHLMAADDALEARWVTLDELAQLDTLPRVIELAERALQAGGPSAH